MAFDYPSVATEKKLAKKKAKEVKEAKEEAAKNKPFNPIFDKKEGIKKEISERQIGDAMLRTKGSDKLSNKSLNKIVAAAADDKQLETSKRSLMRNFKSGGRASYKGGGMSKRGLGRAFMKGGKA